MNKRSAGGMTFAEVLIAIVISGIVLSSILTVLNFSSRYAQHNANKTMALNFAQELLERIINEDYEDTYANEANYHTGAYTNFLGPELNTVDSVEADDDLDGDDIVLVSEFDDVDDYNGYSDTVDLFQNDNTSVQAARTVSVKDQTGNSSLDEAGYANTEYKQVAVTVSWNWLGDSYSESVNTIVSFWKNE